MIRRILPIPSRASDRRRGGRGAAWLALAAFGVALGLAPATGAGTARADSAAVVVDGITLPANCSPARDGDTVTVSCVYGYSGGEQTFSVPAGIKSLSATAVGAPGGVDPRDTTARGLGGVATATLSVTPNETLYVEVGGAGGDSQEGVAPPGSGRGAGGAGGAGGFNGGGNGGAGGIGAPEDQGGDGGGGGGGASDVRTMSMAASDSLASRLLVAAGGGGAGGFFDEAGGAAGQPGGAQFSGQGGQPGTSSGGGAGGGGEGPGGAGSLGIGGGGGGPALKADGGGGGGGGLFGGGGGSVEAGGGGGSSLGATTGIASTATPSVTLAYTLHAAPTQSGLSCAPSPLTYGASVTCTATVTDTNTSATPVAPSGPITLTTTGGGAFSPASGACTLSPVAGSAGTASCSVSYTPAAGQDLLTASYGGNNTHSGSSSARFTLTITPAPLTITANDARMTYGGPLPAFDASYSGFVNGDTAAALRQAPRCHTTATSRSPAGTYPITCDSAVADNYTASYVTGTLTIAQAPLTITASSPSVVYDGSVPTITPSYSGFISGDSAASLSSAPTCTASAPSSGDAGTYTTNCSGAVDPNYSIGYVGGTLVISPAAQTITVISTPPSPALAGTTYAVAATGGASGNPVTFTAGPSSVCSAGGTNGATIGFVGAGTCTITASQAGDQDYQAAPDVTQTVTVSMPLAPLALYLSVSSSPPGPVTAGSTVTLTDTLTDNTALTQTVRLVDTLSYTSPWGRIAMGTVRGTLTLAPGQTLGRPVHFAIPWWFPRGTYTLSVQATDTSGDSASGSVSLTVT